MSTTIDGTAQLEHQIGPTGRFSLKVPSGSITIRGIDGDVARIRDLTGRALADRFTIDSGTGHLSLEARWRFGLGIQIGRSSDEELEIEVPHSASVLIDTASADVEATGLAGPKRFKTASGDIALADVAGDLEVEAVSGDVTVTAIDRIDARVRTISGDLSLRAPSLTRLEAGTTSGDFRLDAELSGAGPFSVRSISGDMTIVSRGAFSVEAQTITGDLVTALEHRLSSAPGRKTLVIGRDGPILQFKSVSGDLQIVEPRDAAPHGATSPAAMPSGLDPAAASEPTDIATARLDILRALERGDLSVEAATDQLTELEAPVR